MSPLLRGRVRLAPTSFRAGPSRGSDFSGTFLPGSIGWHDVGFWGVDTLVDSTQHRNVVNTEKFGVYYISAMHYDTSENIVILYA